MHFFDVPVPNKFLVFRVERVPWNNWAKNIRATCRGVPVLWFVQSFLMWPDCCIIIATAVDYNAYEGRPDIDLMIFHLTCNVAAAVATASRRHIQGGSKMALVNKRLTKKLHTRHPINTTSVVYYVAQKELFAQRWRFPTTHRPIVFLWLFWKN